MCMDFDTCYLYFSQPARHVPCFRGEDRDSRKAPSGPELGLAKQAFEAHSIDSTSWSVHLVMASLLVNLDRRGICSGLLSGALVFLGNESFFICMPSLMAAFFFPGLGSPISYFRLLSSLACVQRRAAVSLFLLLLICTEPWLLASIPAAKPCPFVSAWCSHPSPALSPLALHLAPLHYSRFLSNITFFSKHPAGCKLPLHSSHLVFYGPLSCFSFFSSWIWCSVNVC